MYQLGRWLLSANPSFVENTERKWEVEGNQRFWGFLWTAREPIEPSLKPTEPSLEPTFQVSVWCKPSLARLNFPRAEPRVGSARLDSSQAQGFA
jgi:hypothetical protein